VSLIRKEQKQKQKAFDGLLKYGGECTSTKKIPTKKIPPLY
jgi:hypothetical protein